MLILLAHVFQPNSYAAKVNINNTRMPADSTSSTTRANSAGLSRRALGDYIAAQNEHKYILVDRLNVYVHVFAGYQLCG